MAEQLCCSAEQQSCTAKRFVAFRHHIIIIAPAREEAMTGWGEIISLYALPEYFGKGCGKALFGYVTDRLKAQGFQKLYLWVLEENRRARAFYERQGFMPNGDQTQITIAGKALTELRYTKSFPAFW